MLKDVSMAENKVGSILAVDFGSVRTRVVLIDSVDGVYRLVVRGETRTTDGYPANDIMIGFERVLKQLTEATGRRFLTDTGKVIVPEQRDRSGVDVFAVTASIGRPLRAVVIGLMPGVSIASAIRAASGTYIDVAQSVSLDDGRTEEERLNAILLSHPDVIFLTGGVDGGPKSPVLALARLARLAVALIDRARRPTVIYSGNNTLAAEISTLFEDVATVLVAENVRPAMEKEQFDSARLQLGQAFDRYKENRSESFANLSQMSQTGVLPTGQSYTVLADYLGKTQYENVALMDIGSSASTLAVSLAGRVSTSIRTDIGLGHSAAELLERAGMEEITRWLPFATTHAELLNYTLNKSLRPGTIPGTLYDLHIEHALLKAGARLMLGSVKWDYGRTPLDLVIGAGTAFTGTGSPAYTALLLLDALQPTGVTTLQSDPFGMVAAMGAIALHTPEAVVQLLEEGNLNTLGTCIALDGKPPLDKRAAQVKITFADGDVVEESVMGGHLWMIPLQTYEQAEVEINCQAGTSINGKRRVKLTVSGGTVGLIIDGRGRPLSLAADLATRAAQVSQWIHELTGDPLLEIDPAWLEAKEEPETGLPGEKPPQKGKSTKQKQAKPPKKGRRGKKKGDDEPTDAELEALFGEPDADDEIDELRNVLS